jgi:hypothetical protein
VLLAAALLAAGISLAGTGCGGDDGAEPTGDPGEVSVELEARNGSNVAGVRAVLAWPSESSTRVLVDGLDQGEPAGGGRHPAHVHRGSCDDEGEAAYELEPVSGAASSTTVEAGLDELLSGGYSIDVHLAEDDPQVIACADLPEEAPAAG